MLKRLRIWLAYAAFFGGAASANAANIIRTIPAGGKLDVFAYGEVNPDCSLAGETTVRLQQSPEHGGVMTRRSKGFGFFPPSNPRSACNARRVAGVNVTYRPARDFVGTDTFSLDVIFSNGSERLDFYTIYVK